MLCLLPAVPTLCSNQVSLQSPFDKQFEWAKSPSMSCFSSRCQVFILSLSPPLSLLTFLGHCGVCSVLNLPRRHTEMDVVQLVHFAKMDTTTDPIAACFSAATHLALQQLQKEMFGGSPITSHPARSRGRFHPHWPCSGRPQPCWGVMLWRKPCC